MTTISSDRAVSAPDAPHAEPVDAVAAALDVEVSAGLDPAEASRRLEHFGANELEEAPRDPAWRRFASQFVDVLNGILVVAAVLSFVVSGELKTPIVVLVVVVFNAVIGFVQENRAAASLDALREMLVLEVRTRRGGRMVTVPARELVPGDVVAVEAGDRIPADGRVVDAVNLEVEEAALTGESMPVSKTREPSDDPRAGLADRLSMVHMQTTVTRGRGELIVTTTGMETEIGRIAGMLRDTPPSKTPLQRQLDHLAHSLAKLAGVIVVLVAGIGLARGQDLSDVVLTAVALAVASIPEGLPAVTAVTLAIGVSRMAKEHAIVKRLASVETLGCTTVICSDKTGTLTLNEMTAERVAVRGQVLAVEGRGYAPEGEIVGLDDPDLLDDAAEVMVLCNEANLVDDDGWRMVGDPTEGALVVLAAKAGVDPGERRDARPRVAEVPFDSANKFMATVHDAGDGDRVDVLVKGGPDVVLARCRAVEGPDGEVAVDEAMPELEELNEAFATDGLRVLAVARRSVSRADFDAVDDPVELVEDLTLLALIGIVDPPRPEARDAIEVAREAGISVKMITGDHAATATSIGAQLGLGERGELGTLTGADLDDLDDDALDERLADTAVFARVSPEHKLRLVEALGRRGEVVSMTGDGVNDAPALSRADMGVAMGITGTEVTKDAATMVLTDDNFATIVTAVRRGRTIYDNIVKFVRFQLSTTVAFAIVFLAAAVFDLSGGAPFAAIAILWVNIIMDGPPAMALGLDPEDDSVMHRSPRPRDEPILTRPRWAAIGLSAAVMALGTLAVLAWAPGPAAEAGVATVAGTMAFNTFVLAQFFNIHNVRSDHRSVVHPLTLRNWKLWAALGIAAVLQVAVTHVGFLQDLFDTTSISLGQWLVCLAVASTVVVAEELRKLIRRR